MTDPELDGAARAQKPGKPFLVVEGRTLTFGAQWQRHRALQDWLRDQGVPVGAPVLVAVTDELEQASLLLGLISCGRPPLVLDPGGTAAEAAIILSNSEFSAVVAEPALHEGWGLSHWRRPWLRVGVRKGSGGVFGGLLRKRQQSEEEPGWPELVGRSSGDRIEEPEAIASDSLAYVMYTSGTTSRPKGVEIVRGALVSQLQVLFDQYGLDASCRLLDTLPLYHADGLIQGPVLAWFGGLTVYRPLAFSVQTLQGYLDSIYRDRITHLIAVPTMLSLIYRLGLEWRENFASPDFRFIVSCAGHLERGLWELLEEELGVPVVNMYGLTETVTSALFSGPDGRTRRVGSLGMPVNCRIRLVDEQGEEVAPGESGELWISSDQLMRGYHCDPEGTAEVLRDGWLRTGDLVSLLDTGHLLLVGRKKNQIITGGRNVSPEDVAGVLNLHPAVSESVVLGLPDADWGERVAALVVSDGQGLDEEDLAAWCRARISEYKVPKRILFVEGLPKGPSGKVRLDAARGLLDQQVDEAAKEDGLQALGERVRAIAANTFRLHIEELPANASPATTPGWDSLTHIGLVVALEGALGIRFSAREIMQMDSLARVQLLCRDKVGG